MDRYIHRTLGTSRGAQGEAIQSRGEIIASYDDVRRP